MARFAEYRGRVAVITGASAGIGAQFARDLAGRGMKVALLARRLDRLEALAAEIGRASGEALPLACDVADRASVEAAIAQVVTRWDQLDLLVNNAAYNRHTLFKDHDVDDIARMMQTNFMGTVYAIKAALPVMRRQGRGWIVNLSSVAGRLGQPDEVAYSATKFAVAGLSEGLAIELAPLGIHVMAVYPALVRTEMFTPDVIARMPRQALAQFVEPPVFTRAVLHALERGAFEVTVPRHVGIAYVARALFPNLLRRQTAKMRLPLLPDLVS